MADIFGYTRNPKPAGVFSISKSLVKFGAAGNGSVTTPDAKDLLGLLIQSWQVSYQNNVTEIFELGSDNIYWIKGRPTGAGSIGRIIGLKNLLLFPPEAFDACNGGVTMEISAMPGACPGTALMGVDITTNGTIIVQIGFDANVADTRINEGISFRFASLETKEKTA